MMKPSFVYLIFNRINGKCYIGKSNKPHARFREHMKGSHNKYLNKSIAKYGIDVFDFWVVEEWHTEKRAYEAEEELVAYLRAIGAQLYNLSGGGEGAGAMSDTTREKLHQIAKAQFSDPEQCQKHIEATKKGLTPEVIQRAVEKRVANDEWRVSLSRGQKNRFSRPEERAKTSAATSITMTPARRAEIGDQHRGKKDSVETRKRKSHAAKGKPKSLQHRENMKRAQARRRFLEFLRKRLKRLENG